MWDAKSPLHLHQMHDLSGGRESSTPREVWLQDINHPSVNQLLKTPLRGLLLTCCNLHIDRFADSSIAFVILRMQEIFNYALYDQPHVVREVIGFGGPMDELPLMLHDFAIEMVWAPMVKLVGEALGKPVDKIAVEVERLPLERSIEVPGMGGFAAGSQGAFRFELQGYHAGKKLYVLEHVTRIDDACAPHWPYPPQGSGCHQVIISGDPDLHVTLHAQDHHEPGAAGGGNASAASWVVNTVPAVCAARSGVITVLDLPRITGAAQLQIG